MLGCYNDMTLAMGITGLVAYAASRSPDLIATISGTPLQWVVMLAPLGFVFFLSFRINKMSASAAQITFWLFSKSEEHTSALQSLMRISYAFFCLTQQSTCRPSCLPQMK